jgi:hypothetical protein
MDSASGYKPLKLGVEAAALSKVNSRCPRHLDKAGGHRWAGAHARARVPMYYIYLLYIKVGQYGH